MLSMPSPTPSGTDCRTIGAAPAQSLSLCVPRVVLVGAGSRRVARHRHCLALPRLPGLGLQPPHRRGQARGGSGIDRSPRQVPGSVRHRNHGGKVLPYLGIVRRRRSRRAESRGFHHAQPSCFWLVTKSKCLSVLGGWRRRFRYTT